MMLTVVVFIYDVGLLISVFKLVINQRSIHTNRLFQPRCSSMVLFTYSSLGLIIVGTPVLPFKTRLGFMGHSLFSVCLQL